MKKHKPKGSIDKKTSIKCLANHKHWCEQYRYELKLCLLTFWEITTMLKHTVILQIPEIIHSHTVHVHL